MASLGNILLDKEILLESGTNELEMLVFRLADFVFGINVAKVREVLPAGDITTLPKAHNSVRGVFRLRENVIPCVSLLDHLQVKATVDDTESTMILTDFNGQQTAFLVDEVERIHRLSWENVLPVPNLMSLSNTPVTAVARINERLIVVLDFEMIIDQVTDKAFRTESVENPLGLSRGDLRVVLADDSPTIREAVCETLKASGYTNLQVFQNGAEVWNWLGEQLEQGHSREDIADLLISDIEMPSIDGFHLTKKIKQHPSLNSLPVLLYSSMVTPDNEKKGEAVGADAQISKPQLDQVVGIADQLISESKAGRQSTPSTAMNEPVLTEEESGTETTSITPQPVESTPKVETPASAPAPEVAKTMPEPPKPAAAPAPSASVSSSKLSSIPPNESNPHLWQTFRRELTERVEHLEKLFSDMLDQEPNEDFYAETFRTLHTIKSASMVIPVDEVSRVTHLVESRLEPARNDASLWPHDELGQYVSWLRDLSATSEVAAVLSSVAPLEAAIQAQVSKA